MLLELEALRERLKLLREPSPKVVLSHVLIDSFLQLSSVPPSIDELQHVTMTAFHRSPFDLTVVLPISQ